MAAYISKHRYWTGLLLLIRVAFYLEIAYNTSNEVNASPLATGLIAACLLLLKAYRGKIYKKGMIDCLDTFTYFNPLILSIAQLYSQHNKIGQMISAKISVSAAFLQLLFVLIYHMANTFLEIFCQNRLSHAHRLQKLSKPGKLLPLNSQATELMIQVKTTGVTPTSTEIGLSDSEEASVTEYGKEKDTSGRVSQSLTTKWEDTNSLCEPLLQEEL